MYACMYIYIYMFMYVYTSPGSISKFGFLLNLSGDPASKRFSGLQQRPVVLFFLELYLQLDGLGFNPTYNT